MKKYAIQKRTCYIDDVVSNAINGTDKPERGWVNVAIVEDNYVSDARLLVNHIRNESIIYGTFRVKKIGEE